MTAPRRPKIAVVDCAHGNLFSIANACKRVGLEPDITHDPAVIQLADAVLLPGVGAFANAMQALEERRLISPLLAAAETGKTVVGICLGMQLLFEESSEFGNHKGLGLFEGEVVRFEEYQDHGLRSKVPQVGWNLARPAKAESEGGWSGTILNGLAPDYAYFLHSYYARPKHSDVTLTLTDYAGLSYSSSVQKDNVIAFQFHPERSGSFGLAILQKIADRVYG